MISWVRQAEPIDEIEEFRLERIALLRRNEQAFKMKEGAKFILHLVPQNVSVHTTFEEKIFDLDKDDLKPMAAGGWSHKINFDGIASVTSKTGESDSYVQLFHSGAVESVNTSYFHHIDGNMYIPITGWEDELIKRVPNYLNMQKALGVKVPIHLLISLLSVGGYQFMINDSYARSEGEKIDREDLLVPAVEINSFDCKVEQVLFPAFNRLWNAAGRKGSISYNSDGSRKRR